MKSFKTKFFLALVAALVVLNACVDTTTPIAPTGGNTSVTGTTQTLSTGPCTPMPTTFAGGNGSTASPNIITGFCHLYLLANAPSYWTDNFVLGANIDMTGITFTPLIEFSGVFNGTGFSISNWNNQNSPLFTQNSGTIENLSVLNSTMVPLGSTRPGILVGTNMPGATIDNCVTQGSIAGVSAANQDLDGDIYWFVGGLVSLNMGTIRQSHAAVNVSGRQSVGGLVGQNEGTIQTSFSVGSVSSTSSGAGFGAGGLVGTHTAGSILNSYSTGPVQGVSQVGGLVGFSSSIITNSFSSGAVNGTGSSLGGFIGQNTGGATSGSFWDENTSGQAASSGSGATAETTAAMEAQGTFVGWDFNNTWNPPTGSYPTLR